jgi:hypothetical protein
VAELNIAKRILEIILALALLGGLIFAGWRVYRSLPVSPAEREVAAGNSELTIILHDALANGDTKVDLYPVDFASIERDFGQYGRQRRRFEDFLAQRLKNVTPVQARMDRQGRAVARLRAGNWWMHATTALANNESYEWRLPMVITQRTHTVELSAANAYERTRKF